MSSVGGLCNARSTALSPNHAGGPTASVAHDFDDGIPGKSVGEGGAQLSTVSSFAFSEGAATNHPGRRSVANEAVNGDAILLGDQLQRRRGFDRPAPLECKRESAALE